MIYIVGSQLEGENVALLKEAMTTLGFPYRLSSFTTSIQYHREEILHEAQACKPNLIMCLGTSALLLFAPDVEDKMAAARAYDGDYQDILVKCTYSPNFLVKRGGMRTKEFQTFQQDIKLAYEQATQTGDREAIEVQLYSPEEYLDFMAAYMNEPVVALDYEGSSLNPLEEKYRIAGIGLATDKKAGYLWFEDYATVGRELPAATMRKLARFMQVLDTKKPRVFNANYETLVTTNVFNVRLTQCNDVMQNLRTLDITGGLKEIAASRLGIRGWTRDIDDWLENLKVVVGIFKPTARAAKKEYKILETDGIEAALQHIGAKELKNTPTQVEALRYILGKSEELYGPDEALNALERYLTYLNRINDWEVRYNHVPKEILGKYCGLDCHYTYQLEDKYRPELEARGLADAAMYYNQQMQFGIEAELDGFAWDDAFAERLDAEYRVEAMNALRNFLLAAPVSQTLGLTNPVAQIEIKSATDIETLKKYFNPNNNQAENTALLGTILLQSRVRLALVLREVNNLAQNTSEEETKKQYPTLFKLTQRYKQFVDNGTAHQFIDFCNQTLRKAKEANVLTDDERGILIRYTRYTLPDASAETVEMLANAASIYLGVDLEDSNTWTGEYQAVFYYKLFKKIDKVISAFINGKNGRQMVQVVKEDTTKPYMVRVDDYRPVLSDGEQHYYCPHYGVNSAATRRWTSAYHGIPGNGEIKGALIPRYKNGFFLHADFSQNEYRVFAALAGEEAIMQAFREGKDIHRFIAAKVFNKPEKEITGAERNVAKRLSFGLLYGKGIPAIAEEYFRGDVKYAQSLFDMFFNMFPRIKAYMEEQKQMLFDKGYITTVWGDPIYLPYDASSVSSVNEAIRYAINYPTQSTASSAAALTGFELKKMARERKWELAIPGFIHDCLEGDFGHNYFLEVFDQLPQLAEEWPYEAFKLPLSLDIELGVRGGPYLVEFKRAGEDRRFVRDGVMRAKFEGRKDAVEEMFERLESEGRYNVTVTDTEEEESYGNWKELYMKVASAYHRGMGRKVTTMTGKVEVSLR